MTLAPEIHPDPSAEAGLALIVRNLDVGHGTYAFGQYLVQTVGPRVGRTTLNCVLLDPGAVIPRLLTVDGVDMAVENGVGRDILSNGMATLADATIGSETLALTVVGHAFVVSNLGRDVLEAAARGTS